MLAAFRLLSSRMPLTRSSSRLASQTLPIQPQAPTKRKASTGDTDATPKKARVTAKSKTPSTSSAAVSGSVVGKFVEEDTSPLIPAVLSFSFEDAKAHLVDVDSRFKDLFDKMECKPFQRLERVHPFRALVESILGQQISWKAARSIKHKFIRLYDPSLPENVPVNEPGTESFPTPYQVAQTDIATLRTAGLSVRKAEYVQDLAMRFADGRLSTNKLNNATDEELAEMLTAVRGIGMWTVNMFAIFSLRRPDILPVGDLGVQRGILRWFLALHSPAHPFSLSPEKVGSQDTPKTPASKNQLDSDDEAEDDILPVFNEQGHVEKDGSLILPGDLSALPPVAGSQEDAAAMPPPFTPSIKKTLGSEQAKQTCEPLPEGLSLAVLKSRKDGKKVKGAFLTPQEMEDLTSRWKPYRSVGVYFMWSLAEGAGK